MGIDQRRDLAIDAGLRQRRRPRDRASRRDRRSASQCWIAQPPQTPKCGQNGVIRSALAALDLDQPPAVGMTAGDRRDLDRFAAQRVRHIDVAAAGDGDAVAVMADMVDDEALDVSHGARP